MPRITISHLLNHYSIVLHIEKPIQIQPKSAEFG